MKLITCIHSDSPKKYFRMLNVLKDSVKKNSPNTELDVRVISDRDLEIKEIGSRREAWYVQNCRKAKHHFRVVDTANEGDLICLIDCDTMVLRDMSPAIEQMEGYDLGLTWKPEGCRLPINSGVVFVRVSDRARTLYSNWLHTARWMLRNQEFYRPWQVQYGGVHQSSLAFMLAQANHDLNVVSLPCEEWNSVRETWCTAPKKARLVHFIGKLRSHILMGTRPQDPEMRKVVYAWREFDEKRRKRC